MFNKQRYEFFSKSQPETLNHVIDFGCCSISKDTNFSANHNGNDAFDTFTKGVVQ